MSQKKLYDCKQEEVPPLAKVLAACLITDKTEFERFSPLLNVAYAATMIDKATDCNNLITSNIRSQQIKMITKKIKTKGKELRIKLNHTNNYIKMAAGSLNLDVDAMGITQVRYSNNSGNTEGVIKNGRVLLNNLESNITALQAVGLQPAFYSELTNLIDEIEVLGNDQTNKKSLRNRHTDNYIGQFNELWVMITLVLSTGKALFRGVDDVKLKDYTLSTIIKRIRATGSRSPHNPDAEIVEPTTPE